MYSYNSKTCIKLNSHSSQIIWKSLYTTPPPYLFFRELATLAGCYVPLLAWVKTQECPWFDLTIWTKIIHVHILVWLVWTKIHTISPPRQSILSLHLVRMWSNFPLYTSLYTPSACQMIPYADLISGPQDW